MSNEIVKMDIATPEHALSVANNLQKFVKEQKLTVDIQGRNYPLVEAWQFAGSQFGLYPILIECKNESSYEERNYTWTDRRNNPKTKKTNHFKYRSLVEVRRFLDDKVLSRGSMVCTNDEGGKHEFAEYAIESMSQTRAEGKAWRMLLAWVMKAAGFEQTPYEEMEEQKETFDNCPTPEEKKMLIKSAYSAKMNDDQRIEALATISGCTDYDLFRRVENRLKELQPSIHEVVNPNAEDVAKAVKEAVKRPNT